ncbi:UNVERIFIED_CONTAM: hypothetical protein Slati_2355000 [Sesamum latifolium]|uniref:Retrotransposon gag domain-containing protein n=1 Tax=Sesamum latifolium TaxID=2727402 RepID=A0AAW2WEY7_9LAMI
MVDQTSLINRVAKLESQVQRLLELFGQAPGSPLVALFPRVDTLNSTVEMLHNTVGGWSDVMGQRVIAAIEEISILTDVVEVKIDSLQAEVNVLKLAVGWDEDLAPVSKFKVSDLKPFVGARSAKELEKFLWVFHYNWVAMESLRKLRHTRTVREFVKEFSSLMLDGVKDLPSAIIAANRLADFKVVNDSEQRQDDSGNSKAKFDSDSATEQTRVGALQLGVLQAQSRACMESRYKAGADVKPCDSQVKAIKSKALPVSGVASTELRVGGNKPTFVREEYEGDIAAGKKSKMAEARQSNALVQSTSGKEETKTAASMRASTLVGGGGLRPMCDDVRQEVRTGAHRCGRPSAGWRTGVYICGRPSAGWRTARTYADDLGRLVDSWHGTCPMGGNPRQTGKDVSMGNAQVRTAQTACAHGRQADGCQQRPKFDGWLYELRHGADSGHVMRRLRADNRPSTWQRWEDCWARL